ncbi:hypothetical protein PENTCL1PPCAC_1332, partial [Pristionchus entomophagus]
SRSSNLRSCLSTALAITGSPSVTSGSFASPSAPTLASFMPTACVLPKFSLIPARVSSLFAGRTTSPSSFRRGSPGFFAAFDDSSFSRFLKSLSEFPCHLSPES